MPEFDEVSKKRLFQAIVDNKLDEINKMVEEGYPVVTATFGKNTATALHLALSRGEVELITIEELIKLGADIYAVDSIGRTPLQSAVSSVDADSEIIEYLRDLYGDNLTPVQARSILTTVLQTQYAQEEIEDEEGNVYNYRDCMLAAIGRGDLIEGAPEENIVNAAGEYLDGMQGVDDTIAQIEGTQQGGDHQVYTAEINPQPSPEMIGAINGLYNKDPLVNTAREDSLYNLIGGMFSKNMPYNIEGLVFEAKSVLESLGIDLTQLAHLVRIASGSGHLPMYHGGFPGGDSGGGSGGSGVMFNNPPLAENEFVVAYLGNLTIITAEQHDHSI